MKSVIQIDLKHSIGFHANKMTQLIMFGECPPVPQNQS